MHYHLLSTDGVTNDKAVRTFATATEAEREALRLAMAIGAWAPKRYPGRTWKRGEVAVYLDRTATADRPPVRRELSIIRCAATSAAAPDCLLRSMGIPALNLEAAPAPEPASTPAIPRGQRLG